MMAFRNGINLSQESRSRRSANRNFQIYDHYESDLSGDPFVAVPEYEDPIYETIYETKWRLLNMEAARLQRENTGNWKPLSSSGSASSSRESSLGPQPLRVATVLNTKSPRQLIVHRQDSSFGFTLRHFIVYPPEEEKNSTDFPSIKEPLDTIFVKSVKEDGPAAGAGLRVGDRIISVNGEPINGRSYGEVVNLIQKSPEYLLLTVCPQQDDVLQMYFSEIAQNPESNTRSTAAKKANPTPPNTNHSKEPPRIVVPSNIRNQSRSNSPFDSISSSKVDEKVEFPRQTPAVLQKAPSQPSSSSRNPYSDELPTVPSSQPKNFFMDLYAQETSKRGISTSLRKVPNNQNQERFNLYGLPLGYRRNGAFDSNVFSRSDNLVIVGGREPFCSPPEQQKQEEVTASSLRNANSSSTTALSVTRPSSLDQGSDCMDGGGGVAAVTASTTRRRRPNTLHFTTNRNKTLSTRRHSDQHQARVPKTQQQQQQPQQQHVVSHASSENNLTATISETTTTSTTNTAVVVKRRRPTRTRASSAAAADEDDERNLRRVSYLKATKELETDSDEDKKNVTSTDGIHKPGHSIQKLRALFGDTPTSSSSLSAPPPPPHHHHTPTTPVPEGIKEGWLTCKVTVVDGKKAPDRSWRNVYAVLKSHALYMYKDKKMAVEQPMACEDSPVSLAESSVEVAEDYTKRRNVFRIKTETGSVYLFQAEGEDVMQQWVQAVEDASMAIVIDERGNRRGSSSGLKKLTTSFKSPPSPMTTASTTSVTQSPKSRTSSSQDGQGASMYQNKKTWKGKVAKQWKKMHGSPSSQANPTSTAASSLCEGSSIGVHLEDCPMSPDNENVPLIIKTCCSIVERKGLEIVGIYRVPGNNAAVTYLTEHINSPTGEEFMTKMEDSRWGDINVVSSLLKSFFRKLPDPLFTAEMYSTFIESSKIEDPSRRINTLKKLIRELPECHYETLKFLCGHLTKVVSRSEANKMESRNLAIVFGPTLVRTADDNMLSMVTDMSQQCRIIESILSNCQWFFNEDEDVEGGGFGGGSEDLNVVVDQHVMSSSGNETLLINNLHKLEDSGKVSSPVRPKDIVSGIISAANRKMMRSQKANIKKESVNEATSSSTTTTNTTTTTTTTARRNSETLIQGVVAIATAVGTIGGESSTTSIDATDNPSKEEEERDDKKYHFPIETYQGLEEATAERIKRFEDETKAMLTRSQCYTRPPQASSDVSSSTISGPSNSLTEGGILLEEPYEAPEKYEPSAQVPSKDRFLSLTYLGSPSVSPRVDGTFDTKKVAGHGTLKRMKLQRQDGSGCDITDDDDDRQQQQQTQNDVISNITANFDEKLRLLLDPHYQSPSSTTSSSTSSDSTPTKAIFRRKSEIISATSHVDVKKQVRSISLGLAESNKMEASVKEQREAENLEQRNRKSELKRGRLVDKNSERSGTNLKRNDSLTKKEKQELNLLRKKCELKLNLKRRIKRRHTVGGTKDFPPQEIEEDGGNINEEDEKENNCFMLLNDGGDQRREEPRLRSLRIVIASSSPDLSASDQAQRRFSLPDPLMNNTTGIQPFPSLLESQV